MYLIGNGRLLTRNPKQPFIENGSVITEGEKIIETGETEALKQKYPQAEFIDAGGGIIMPGIINAHTHITASLARAFPVPECNTAEANTALKSFREKFNARLTLQAIKLSVTAAAIACIKNGITTVFDHYSASTEPAGSLMSISSVIREAGIRACLCCGVSDEYGRTHCESTITENAEFIEYAETLKSNQIKAMFGLSSPSALSNTALKKCIVRNRSRAGFHINFSGDYVELYDSLRKFNVRPVERLYNEGLLGSKTILAGCNYINEKEADIISKTDTITVFDPEENIYLASGIAPAAPIKPMRKEQFFMGMGGGCVTSDMFSSLKAAVVLFKNSTGDLCKAESAASEMLFCENPKIASRFFKLELGKLISGAAADIIVTDYLPYTPFSAENADKHILYGMNGKDCKITMAGGKLLMLNRKVMFVDEEAVSREIVDFTKSLWKQLD